MYGLDLRTETILYSVSELSGQNNDYRFLKNVSYKIRHQGQIVTSMDLGTTDCETTTGFYDRFQFDYQWGGAFDILPDIYSYQDRRLHCPVLFGDQLGEMGPIPQFVYAVDVDGNLAVSQTFYDGSIQNFIYPIGDLNILFGSSISNNMEAFLEIGAY